MFWSQIIAWSQVILAFGLVVATFGLWWSTKHYAKATEKLCKVTESYSKATERMAETMAGQKTTSETQTKIMEEQKAISDRQTKITEEQIRWNRTTWYNAEYLKSKSKLDKNKSEFQAESEKFYSEQHSEQEFQQFESRKLGLILLEVGLIGLRKHIEAEGAYYGCTIIQEHINDDNFLDEIRKELLSIGYSEDDFRVALERFRGCLS